jgi:Ca2+-binding RTX toxin-like protein
VRFRLLLPAFACALTLLCVSAARAATVQVIDEPFNGGHTLEYEADLGEANFLGVALSSGLYGVTDSGAIVTPGPGCSQLGMDVHTAICDATDVVMVRIHLHDMDDRAGLASPAKGQIEGGAGADTILGGQGPDEIQGDGIVIPGSSGGGAGDYIDGREGNDQLDGDVGFSPPGGNDTVIGGPGDDFLTGFVGNDSLDGGPGADILSDGAGNDTVSGGEGDDDYWGDDSDGNDAINGDGGNDILRASRDVDGADTFSGGPGRDALVYNQVTAVGQPVETRVTSVTASLDGAPNDGTGSEGDNIQPDIESVTGGSNDDVLTGGPEAETLDGDAGNDVLDGGGGPDVLVGEGGTDTASYGSRASGVTVTLDDVANDGAPGEADDVTQSVENVTGGRGPDDLTGGPADNRLDGGSGEDFVDGRGGADVLLGGEATDVIRVRDGSADSTPACGPGVDFVIADPGEGGDPDCEAVDNVLSDLVILGHQIAVQPGDATLGLQLPTAHRLVPLFDHVNIPVGSMIDTTAGAAKVTTRAVGSRRKRQAGLFSGALIQVLQRRSRAARGLTELRLKGSSFDRCRAGGGRASAARLSRATIRKLRAKAKGRFRTRGRHSAATVRGTIWITADRCDGTLTRVKRGTVAVRDFRRKRTILVRAGKSYLARAKG